MSVAVAVDWCHWNLMMMDSCHWNLVESRQNMSVAVAAVQKYCVSLELGSIIFLSVIKQVKVFSY